MIGLAECAPCRAKRLQEESEKEFRERYGMIDLNRQPLRMGWKPFMGQTPPAPMVSPAPAPAPAPTAARSYLDNVKERLLWYGVGTGFGYPIGILANVAFKSLRRYRDEAATFAAMMAGVGLVASLIPADRSPLLDTIARVTGLLTGSALADVTLPAQRMTDKLAKAI
jgi:hypothetical protein